MKAKAFHALAIALVGLCWVVVVSAANAESSTPSQQTALRKICNDHAGRFEQSWAYNDQGMQWGEVLSCSTSTAYITCQDDVCRGGRWALSEGATAAGGRPDNGDGAVQFPAEPAAFVEALTALSAR